MASTTDVDKKLLTELRKAQLTPEETRLLVRQLKHPPERRHNAVERDYGKHFRVGVVSDLHVGHKFFRQDILEESVKTFKKEGVEEVYIPGDIIEGMSNRDGHLYELAIPGVSAQVDAAAQLLNLYGKPITAILGNHDLWSMKKSNQGVHVGKQLEEKVKDFHYIGDMSADVKVGNILVRLTHEGNMAYALSYSMQKRINALSGGDKPNVILNGHIHKSLYLFYRNIHAIEAGTLENQTEFMQMKGSPAMVGYWLLDVQHNRNGVAAFTPKFYPFYD